MTNLLRVFGIGGGLAASGVGMLAAAQILFGITMVATCEARASGPGQCKSEWEKGFLLVMGGGGTSAGLNTLNPLLRKPAPKKKRDNRGRFAGGPDASDY